MWSLDKGCASGEAQSVYGLDEGPHCWITEDPEHIQINTRLERQKFSLSHC